MEKGNVDNIIKVKQKNALADTIDKKRLWSSPDIFEKSMVFNIKKILKSIVFFY